jgi:hypothetical protein
VISQAVAQVFISHSGDDRNGWDFFQGLFGSVSHSAFWYAWSGPTPPHSGALFRAISQSASLFVVLSEGMEKPQTRSWVGYEVGVARALNRPVWVFERASTRPVEVPVPFLTGYIQRPDELATLRTFPYFDLVSAAGTNRPDYYTNPEGPNLFTVTCPHDDCKAGYGAFLLEDQNIAPQFSCPVCRKEIVTAPQGPPD